MPFEGTNQSIHDSKQRKVASACFTCERFTLRKTRFHNSCPIMVSTNIRPFYDYNEIIPKLYIGNINSASNADLISQLKITHLVTADLIPLTSVPPVANYMHVKLRDSEDEDLLSRLSETNRFIDSCLNSPDGRCFVHCVAGISRSASIVIGKNDLCLLALFCPDFFSCQTLQYILFLGDHSFVSLSNAQSSNFIRKCFSIGTWKKKSSRSE